MKYFVLLAVTIFLMTQTTTMMTIMTLMIVGTPIVRDAKLGLEPVSSGQPIGKKLHYDMEKIGCCLPQKFPQNYLFPLASDCEF